jgi:glycosyltransferase involved in cell wall biosynthesis
MNSEKPSGTDREPGKITIVLKGYPRLSETFIAQEIYELEKRGLDIHLVSLRQPTDDKIHPIHRQIKAPVLYLPEYLYQQPIRVFKAWLRVRRMPGYRAARKCAFRDLRRVITHNRGRRFGQALVLVAEMPAGTAYLYAHFLHTPSTVTRYASLMTGIPWSASAHAKDIWTSEERDLREKLAELEWLSTCTAANHSYLQSLAVDPGRVHLIYHGLDFQRFSCPNPLFYSRRDGRDPQLPVKLISVGRAVRKKGYDDLLTALASLPKSYHWRLTHIGGGELLGELQAQAANLGIDERICWLGAVPQEGVLQRYRQADLFVLACKVTSDGDRDGLPNVLMEAQSQGVCCLATRISGIPELITDGDNGVLVESGQPELFAGALARLIGDAPLREKLGRQGKSALKEKFDVAHGIDQLMELFTS